MNNDIAEVAAVSAATQLRTPPQPITTDVLLEKYCRPGETSELQVFARVAQAVAQAESTPEARKLWAEVFLKNLLEGAIGAGRIMAAAGADNRATWINCFVQPVADCTTGYDEQRRPGIYTALAEAGETLRRGGGVGYNFSRIRPKGAHVAGTDSEASGPCTFMDVFDSSCKTVMAAGSRRGAQMGILDIGHPDVLEFIQAKRTPGRWNNFNVSVGVSNEFMASLIADDSWELAHTARPSQRLLAEGAWLRSDGMWVYRTVRARELWDAIMRSAYEFAEPGIVFLGNINEDNNLRYCESIEATNPCAEEPLPPYGCCDLGPVILPRFVRNAFAPNAMFDMEAFVAAVKVQVRFLDNVLDATPWPLEQQRAEAQSKRRIGVGFTGLGNTLAMLGLRYDSDAGRKMAAEIAREMAHAAYRASVDLAKERGPFPMFDANGYLTEGTFASRLPQDIRDAIREHGIRNSHLLAIAPTGTVSLAFADNASNGIEPPFSLAYTRNKLMPDGSRKAYPVVDHGLRAYLATLEPALAQALLDKVVAGTVSTGDLPPSMVTALEMNCEDHLAMMGAVQPFVDTAISKTVNVAADYPFEEFKDLYLTAYQLGLKGCATYRPNAILGAVLEATPAPAKEEGEQAQAGSAAAAAVSALADVDPWRVSIDRRPDGELPGVTEKVRFWTQEGKKSLYLVTSFTKVQGVVGGQPVTIERPVEVFMPASQSNEAQQWVTATMRTLSLTARDGRLPKALDDLRKVTWDKGPVRCGTYTKADGTQVPRYHTSEVAALAWSIQQILQRRGVLDADGKPVVPLAASGAGSSADTPAAAPVAGPLLEPGNQSTPVGASAAHGLVAGSRCGECGALAVIKRDGCEYCTNCGALGSCG